MTIDFFLLPVAQSGLTFLVYVILGILWLVGNIAQQKKAKKRAEEMRKRREEREQEEAVSGKKPSKPHPLEKDLETFLGRLSGEIFEDRRQEKEPKEQPPPLPSKPPAVAEKSPIRNAEPESATSQPLAVPAKRPKTNIGGMDLADSYKEMKDIEDALEISYEQMEGELSSQRMETVRQVMVDLSPTMIDFARLPVQRMRAVDANTTPPALKNKKAFKKALLGSVILSPPVALQDPKANER